MIIKCLELKEISKNHYSTRVASIYHLWDKIFYFCKYLSLQLCSVSVDIRVWPSVPHCLQMLLYKINFHCYVSSLLCFVLTQISWSQSNLEHYRIYEIRCRRNILTNCSIGEDLIFSLDLTRILTSHCQLEAKSFSC